ncbi:MAG TPA: ADP-forming succinate--CoA ligase subunit beta [bacterium]|nr:ADP-forming succinate--CoA ligase subunit beta [bacterium]
MKVHEYQAKGIFASYGIPVPLGEVASSPNEARLVAERVAKKVVIKAQVHVGGRGKAGGVQFAATPEEAFRVASAILSMTIKGLPVRKVLVGECLDVKEEYYLGVVIDRRSQKPTIMVSAAGGVDIEEVARVSPEKIHKFAVDPEQGLRAYEARDLAFKIVADGKLALKTADVLSKLYKTFVSVDASLAEINPFVRTASGQMIALDAKLNIDDNALDRRPELQKLRDPESESPYEMRAREKGLSYVKLDGAIGCIVNGAGLAMATMDMIKHYGGEPANFLDIGGSSNPEKVTTAMEIILSDENVKAILFNIFGGITRCDDVAKGIVAALNQMKISVPVVVRLTGTNEDAARRILREVSVTPVATMDEGVKQAIRLSRGGV